VEEAEAEKEEEHPIEEGEVMQEEVDSTIAVEAREEVVEAE